MKSNFWPGKSLLILLAAGLVITAAAWQTKPGKNTHTTADTIPDRNKKIKSVEDALEQLEKSKIELDRTMREKDWEQEIKEALDQLQFDGEKLKKELAEQLKNIDAQKIQMDVQKSIKEIDFENIKKEMQKSLDKVDMQQIKDEIARAMKEVDAAKIKAEVDASVSKINMQKIREEMEKIRDINFKEIEENLKNIKPEIEKSMREAKEGLEKAKQELLLYKNFIDRLEKDGLINKNENYKIEYKNSELTINGKKQPAEVVKKYKSFLKDRKDFTITKDEDDFDIDND